MKTQVHTVSPDTPFAETKSTRARSHRDSAVEAGCTTSERELLTDSSAGRVKELGQEKVVAQLGRAVIVGDLVRCRERVSAFTHERWTTMRLSASGWARARVRRGFGGRVKQGACARLHVVRVLIQMIAT